MDAEFSEDDINCAKNSPQGMAELLTRVRKWMIGIAYSVLGDAAHAEDVAQEAQVRIANHLNNLTDYKCFKPWVYRIVKNMAFTHARKHSWQYMPAYKPEYDYKFVLPVDTISDWEQEQRIIKTFDFLPAIYKEALILKHVQNLTYQEMSEITGYSVKAMEIRLVRARKLLSNYLNVRLQRGRRHDPVGV